MLFWRVVPRDEVEVVVHGRVFELPGIADNSVEVALGGGDKVGVVHEDGAWEVVPPPDAVVNERARKCHPCRACSGDKTSSKRV